MSIQDTAAEPDALASLWDRPGFMIRRAHQIAQMLFLEETGEFNVTPTQYGVLRILEARPGLDQIGVARLLGQDRSTAAMVIGKLVEDGLVERRHCRADRRRRDLILTDAGGTMIAMLADRVRRSHDRLLSVFEPDDADRFLALLRVFVDGFNAEARTPLDPAPKRKAGREPVSGTPLRVSPPPGAA